MRVELPRLLSVLSHELRSPVSVLQGYIRLMQRQRAAGPPDEALLTAMLDATGRIAALGRQATDLSRWLSPREHVALRTITLATLVSDVSARLDAAHGSAILTAGSADATLQTLDPALLAVSLATLAESHYRDLGNSPVLATFSADAIDVRIRMAPASDPPAHEISASGPVVFDRGGLGLGLAVSSYVLDAHAAQVHAAGSSIMDVQFPRERGAA